MCVYIYTQRLKFQLIDCILKKKEKRKQFSDKISLKPDPAKVECRLVELNSAQM